MSLTDLPLSAPPLSDCLLPANTPAIPIWLVTPQTLEARLVALGPQAQGWAVASAFKAAAGTHLLLPAPDGALRGVLFGLGEAGNGEATPFLPAKIASLVPDGDYVFDGDLAQPHLACLAFALQTYRLARYKGASAGGVRLVVPQGVDLAALRRQIDAVAMGRDLINTPANDMGPAELADAARALAASTGATFRCIEGAALEEGFPLIHAVGKGSHRPPRLVDITWGEGGAPKITLVGKGVVFDTGGLDIKPSSGMFLMKKDMGGAATALALGRMVMEAGLPVRLRVILPIVENAVGGNSFRPSDIIRSRKGLSVEIGDTDAEGRLILADALALADEEAPDLLIDLATLTGAARVALGPDLPPFYTDDDVLAADLAQAALEVFDPLWRMPLWKPYAGMLDSKLADTSNISGGAFAGSITAALFLAKFVGQARSWVHLDIFGWTPAAKPGRPEGAEVQAARALFTMLAKRHPAP